VLVIVTGLTTVKVLADGTDATIARVFAVLDNEPTVLIPLLFPSSKFKSALAKPVITTVEPGAMILRRSAVPTVAVYVMIPEEAVPTASVKVKVRDGSAYKAAARVGVKAPVSLAIRFILP
jgi:hypothetical protein